MRQRSQPPKTLRKPSISNRITRTFHALPLQHATNTESLVDFKQNSDDAAGASAPTYQDNEKVVDSKPYILRTLHAMLPPAQNPRRWVDFEQDSEEATRASVPTRPKP